MNTQKSILKNLYDSYKSLKEQLNQAVEFYEKSQISQMLLVTEQQIQHHLYKDIDKTINKDRK